MSSSDLINPSSNARWYCDKDGGVLLNVRTGRIFKLNPVAARMWQLLADPDNALDLGRLVATLQQVYPDAAHNILRSDVEMFLEKMAGVGLISSINSSFPWKPAGAGSRFLSDTIKGVSSPPVANHRIRQAGQKTMKPSRVASLLAFIALPACEIALRVRGFSLVHTLVSACPVRQWKRRKRLPPEQICASVDLACSWYLKRTLCLERSVVGAVILRLYGYPGEVVIGARVIPFHTHAWIEIEGNVVNDTGTVQTFYGVLDRC